MWFVKFKAGALKSHLAAIALATIFKLKFYQKTSTTIKKHQPFEFINKRVVKRKAFKNSKNIDNFLPLCYNSNDLKEKWIKGCFLWKNGLKTKN